MATPSTLRFLATAPKAAEPFLLQELTHIGAQDVAPTRLGATFTGTLETAYRACLWSRVASRIILHLHTWSAPNAEALYQGVRSIAWGDHLKPEGTLSVHVSLGKGRTDNSHFAAQRVKDAVVDQFRTRTGQRPSIDLERPDIRLHVVWDETHATVGIDLSGESLHRRGYRRAGVEAPLKENIAAILLMRAQWPDVVKAGGAFLDPMCGSGTLPIEAAMIAVDMAPGMLRPHFGFRQWGGHDAALWRQLLDEAHERRKAGLACPTPPIMGWDMDGTALGAAQSNAQRAGISDRIQWTQRDVSDVAKGKVVVPPMPQDVPGVVVVNPPYGERLGHALALHTLYAELGHMMQQLCVGWNAYVLVPNTEEDDQDLALGRSLGLRASHRYTVHNGNLKCALLHIPLVTKKREQSHTETASESGERQRESKRKNTGHDTVTPIAIAPEVEMVVNRLRKNHKHMLRVAKREHTTAYRVYDADLPEYAAAVDVYGAHVHVQEYAPPKEIDAALAQTRMRHLLQAISIALDVPATHLHLKVREKQKGTQQYQRMAARGHYFKVMENKLSFWVNLTDYLDTGLFLDHRLTRKLVGTMAKDTDFLNLFAYTGSATVYAAAGGARTTTTVDMSNSYITWAEKNLTANHFTSAEHRLIQDDCFAWITDAQRSSQRYGLIFVDPPTFSNSKRMDGTWDVQRDHVHLLQQCAKLLTRDGAIVFSNNFRRFKIDHEGLKKEAGLSVEDITARTIPEDFKRNPRIHQCFILRP